MNKVKDLRYAILWEQPVDARLVRAAFRQWT
jgi:hypothetical protein